MTATPPAPTLTGHTDADPVPRVEVVIAPMPVDAASVTVWRSWRGQRVPVRGAKQALVSGDHLVIDYEAPLGTPVSYSVVAYDSGGTPSEESDPTVITVEVDDVWIQDPLDPTSGLQVGLDTKRALQAVDPSFTASYPINLTVEQPSLDDLGIAFGQRRRAASGVPLTIHATGASAAGLLQQLLQQSMPLCVRTPAQVTTLSGLTYLAIGPHTPDPKAGWRDWLFRLVGDSVHGPGAGVIVEPRTYDHLPDEAATYTALAALYPSYIDLQRGA